MRHEDTPDLFGSGIGSSTVAPTHCDFCNTTYNEDNIDTEGDPIDRDCWIRDTNFAGLFVCDCCFERIENEILRRMPDILAWYRRILDKREQRLKRDRGLLKKLEGGKGETDA